MGEHLSITEASKVLGVSTRTVRRWIGAGTLPGVRLPGRGGGEYRIARDAVDRLLTEGVPRADVNPLDSVPRCAATKADGTKCQGLAVKGTKFCRHHQERQK